MSVAWLILDFCQKNGVRKGGQMHEHVKLSPPLHDVWWRCFWQHSLLSEAPTISSILHICTGKPRRAWMDLCQSEDIHFWDITEADFSRHSAETNLQNSLDSLLKSQCYVWEKVGFGYVWCLGSQGLKKQPEMPSAQSASLCEVNKAIPSSWGWWSPGLW